MPSHDEGASKVGIALSGGGSRAMAFHLGCLRALDELGTLSKARVLATVSGGSVIGAMYAVHDGSFAEFEERVRSVLRIGFVRPAIGTLLRTTEGLKAAVSFIMLLATWAWLVPVRFAVKALSWVAADDGAKQAGAAFRDRRLARVSAMSSQPGGISASHSTTDGQRSQRMRAISADGTGGSGLSALASSMRKSFSAATDGENVAYQPPRVQSRPGAPDISQIFADRSSAMSIAPESKSSQPCA